MAYTEDDEDLNRSLMPLNYNEDQVVDTSEATSCSKAYTLSALSRIKTAKMCLLERDEEEDEMERVVGARGPKLKKVLSLLDLMGYGIASTLGSGIFSMAGLAARFYAGPSVMISFLFGGITCVFSALSYAEFAANLPMAGSAYSYAYTTLGELMAFMIGWDLTLEYGISAAVEARSWSAYLINFIELTGATAPTWLNSLEIGSLVCSPLSSIIVILLSVLVLLGIKESAVFNNVFTVINLLLLSFMVIVGAFYIQASNWVPFFGTFGFRGTIFGVSKIFYAFIGFDAVSTLAEEVSRPQRDLPRGILGSLAVCTLIYVAVPLVLTGMVKYTEIDPSAGLSKAFETRGVLWASYIVSVGAILSLTACVLCSLLGQPRVYYRMAKDGLLFSAFGKIHPRFGTPVWSILIVGIVVSILAFTMSLDSLSGMISVGTLMAFVIVCSAVLINRYTYRAHIHEDNPRSNIKFWLVYLAILCNCILLAFSVQYWPYYVGIVIFVSFLVFVFLMSRLESNILPAHFKCPWVPLVPCLGMCFNIMWLCTLSWEAWVRMLIWCAIGLFIYFTYGIRHSKLRTTSSGVMTSIMGDTNDEDDKMD